MSLNKEVREFIEDICFYGNFNLNIEENVFTLTLNKIKNKDIDIQKVLDFIKKHISKEKVTLEITEDPLEDWLNIELKVEIK